MFNKLEEVRNNVTKENGSYTFQLDVKYNRHKVRIDPVNLSTAPYEADVNVDGLRYNLLFGPTFAGNFVCIPNWNRGYDLADLTDLFWNSESFDREAIRSDDDDANRIAVDAIVQSLAILYYLTPEYTRWRHKNNR